MSERYLLVNNLDAQNRRWLQQNIADKPSDVTIFDWNEHQEEWRRKNMTMIISSFPTFVEKDGDLQFAVSGIIDWDDAINQINWQKELLLYGDDEEKVNIIQKKTRARRFVQYCMQFLQEQNEDHKAFILQTIDLSLFSTTEDVFQKMIEFGQECEISSARLTSAVLI
ncbi:MAG: hypothetical protein EBR94_11000 [Bacteroidetes bacterium]|nr:hypothetical protein [Bacteroidota bacterium]